MNKCSQKDTLIGRSLYYGLIIKKLLKHIKLFLNGLTGSYRGPFEIRLNSEENLYVKLSTVPMMDSDGKYSWRYLYY